MNTHTTIATARHDAASQAVARYSERERWASHLPDAYKVRLIRKLAYDLTYSDGADQVLCGCDAIDADLATETLRNDEPQLYSGRNV